jgi:hypothetical protein
MKSKKRKREILSTSRIDLDTVYKVKTLEHEILKNTGVRLTQWEIIKYAISYVMEKRKDYIIYARECKREDSETAFDTITRVTGKPWFP